MTEQENVRSYVVFLFGWELFPLQELSTSLVPESVPRKFIHIGVGVYNKLYDFNQHGVHCNHSMPEGFEILSKQNDNKYFLTSKKQKELDDWLMEKSQRTRFGPNNSYDVQTNNCLCFAEAVCQFLEVPFEGEHARLKEWLTTSTIVTTADEILQKHPKLARFIGSSLAISRSTGSSTSVVGVYDTVETAMKEFAVQGIMKTQYKISNSGAAYQEEDASVDPEDL